MENAKERLDALVKENGIKQIQKDILNLLYARGVIDKKPDGEFDMDKSEYCGLIFINKKIQLKRDDCDETYDALVGVQMIIGDDDLVAEGLYQYVTQTCDRPAIGKFIKKIMRDFYGSLSDFINDVLKK